MKYDYMILHGNLNNQLTFKCDDMRTKKYVIKIHWSRFTLEINLSCLNQPLNPESTL